MNLKRTRGAVTLLYAACLLSSQVVSSDELPSGSLVTQTSPAGPLQNRLVLDWISGIGPVRLLLYDSRWINRDSDPVRTVVGMTNEIAVAGPVTLHGIFSEWWNPSSSSTAVFETGDRSRLVLDTANPPTRRSGISVTPFPPILLTLLRHNDVTAADVMARTTATSGSPIAEVALGFTAIKSVVTSDWFLSQPEQASLAAGTNQIWRLAGRLRIDVANGATIDASLLGSFGSAVAPGYRARLALVCDPCIRVAAPIGGLIPVAATAATTLVTPFFRSSRGSIESTGLLHSSHFEWRLGGVGSVVSSLHLESSWCPEAILFASPLSLSLLAPPSLSAAICLLIDDPLRFAWTVDVAVPVLSEPKPTVQSEMNFEWIAGTVTVEPQVGLVAWPQPEQLLKAEVALSAPQDHSPMAIDAAVGVDISRTCTTVAADVTVSTSLPVYADLPVIEAQGSHCVGWVTIAGDWSSESGWQFNGEAGWRMSW